MKLDKDQLKQLKEFSLMDFKELNDVKQLSIRYFGLYSTEVRLINMELKRRKSFKPGLKLAVENIRKLIKDCQQEIKRLESCMFNPDMIYSFKDLKPLTIRSRHQPDVLTGKLAYRIACERIQFLEANIKQFEQHLEILRDGNRVTAITMDIIEAYNINPNQYRLDLIARLSIVNKKVFPGTLKHKPTMRRKAVPEPVKDSGPGIGDMLVCGVNKNFQPGSYKIVIGGVGWNRYYCRKLIDAIEPEPGYRLFVVGYDGGCGHYIVSVPEALCTECAKRSGFAKGFGTEWYYRRTRTQFSEIKP